MPVPEEKKVVHIADVVRHGEKLIIPTGMTIKEAKDLLTRREKYEEEQVDINEQIPCFVWDGALALSKAMARKFGFASAEVIPGGFFRPDQKPQMISIECGFGKTVLVPWGRFSIPNIEGYLETQLTEKEGKYIFTIRAIVRRMYTEIVHELIEMTRKIVAEESIYLGQAIRIKFLDNNNIVNPMPQPSFLDLRKVKPDELIYAKDVNDAVTTSIFAPIEHTAECRKHKIPLKRGVLLSGPYGTGKTLAAYVTAKKAIDNKWTFLYCASANELGEMVRFAKQYQPAVIFCEDIDREVNGARTAEMDDILNIVDGIESKNSEIMIILTTNHVENINKALLRPGRLDAVINVLPPDAEAAERLIRLYGGRLINANEDLKAAGELMAGKIPAVIRECVERSKLTAIKNNGGELGEKLRITGIDLAEAGKSMQHQLTLLAEQEPSKSLDELFGLKMRDLITDVVTTKNVPVLVELQEISETLDNYVNG